MERDKSGRIILRPGDAFEDYEILFAPTLWALGVDVSAWIVEHPQLVVTELAILHRNDRGGLHALSMVVFYRALAESAERP